MSAATNTPRVRTILICDAAFASEIEEGVFNLEGVRQHLSAPSFPWRADLSVFLVLSMSRKGRYPGRIEVKREDDRLIRYEPFQTTFEQDNEVLFIPVDVPSCTFPEPGWYNFQVHLTSPEGEEALKGEHLFPVFATEE